MIERTVAVFGSSRTEPGSDEWTDAMTVGSRLAGAGIAVVTGGYGGTMEAVSEGAAAKGGTVIGVTAPTLFTGRREANSHVTWEITASSLAERIGLLISEADGVIVLPGSIGTAAEFVVSWNLNDVARKNSGARLPTVAVGDGWSDLTQFLTERMGAFAGDVHTVETIKEALEWLLEQPEMRGKADPRL